MHESACKSNHCHETEYWKTITRPVVTSMPSLDARKQASTTEINAGYRLQHFSL